MIQAHLVTKEELVREIEGLRYEREQMFQAIVDADQIIDDLKGIIREQNIEIDQLEQKLS